MTYEFISTVAFPKYQGGLVINMMPIIFGDPSSIPLELHGYLPLIEKCNRLTPGLVAYLTVHESLVQKASTQRRPGIHTDGTNMMSWGGSGWGGGGRPIKPDPVKPPPIKPRPIKPLPPCQPESERSKGIYMASSDGTCRVWDTQTPPEGVDAHGGLLAYPTAESELMTPQSLYWMTDRTPHASQMVMKDTERQFFRLVSDEVGGWWKQHSTANPLGIQPTCRILTHSKF